jgi:hypothetical protein
MNMEVGWLDRLYIGRAMSYTGHLFFFFFLLDLQTSRPSFLLDLQTSRPSFLLDLQTSRPSFLLDLQTSRPSSIG